MCTCTNPVIAVKFPKNNSCGVSIVMDINYAYLLSPQKIIKFRYINTQETVVVILILYTVDSLVLFHPPITRHSVVDSDTVVAKATGYGRSPT